METRPGLKIVSSREIPAEKPKAPPSRKWEAVRLCALLLLSIILWAGVIWYCIEMWKARS